MIELKTGAVIDKEEICIGDFEDGTAYGPRLGYLMTFNPCVICKTSSKCKKTTFRSCEQEYMKLWKEKFEKVGGNV